MKLIPLEEVNKIYRKIRFPSDEIFDFYDDICLIKGIDPIAIIDEMIEESKTRSNMFNSENFKNTEKQVQINLQELRSEIEKMEDENAEKAWNYDQPCK